MSVSMRIAPLFPRNGRNLRPFEDQYTFLLQLFQNGERQFTVLPAERLQRLDNRDFGSQSAKRLRQFHADGGRHRG